MKTEETLNYPQTKQAMETYKKTLKNILKSISKTLLIETLVEMKILKQDYVTNEVTLK